MNSPKLHSRTSRPCVPSRICVLTRSVCVHVCVEHFLWFHGEQMHICPGVSRGNNDISAPAAHRDFLFHPKDPHLCGVKHRSPYGQRGEGCVCAFTNATCARGCFSLRHGYVNICMCAGAYVSSKKTPKLSFALLHRAPFCIPALTFIKRVVT